MRCFFCALFSALGLDMCDYDGDGYTQRQGDCAPCNADILPNSPECPEGEGLSCE